MDNLQPAVAAVFVIALLSLGGYYGWKQVRTLRRLRRQPELPAEDRRYHFSQAWVRLVCCGLMVLMAAMIGGSYLFGLEKKADQLAQDQDVQPAEGEHPPPDAEQKQFVKLYARLWGAVLVVVMLMLFLAAYDIWAIRRYALRHHRQIQVDRREMIEKELSLFRTQRNGHT